MHILRELVPALKIHSSSWAIFLLLVWLLSLWNITRFHYQFYIKSFKYLKLIASIILSYKHLIMILFNKRQTNSSIYVVCIWMITKWVLSSLSKRIRDPLQYSFQSWRKIQEYYFQLEKIYSTFSPTEYTASHMCTNWNRYYSIVLNKIPWASKNNSGWQYNSMLFRVRVDLL